MRGGSRSPLVWNDDFRDIVAKIDFHVLHGSRYAVAIDPFTQEVVERGAVPEGLSLDFKAIVAA